MARSSIRPWPARVGAVFCALSIGAVLVSCGEGGDEESTGVDALSGLTGDTIGLVSLDSVQSLELRFVLQEGAGIDSRALGGDVRYTEAPLDSLPELLDLGQVDGALLSGQSAHAMQADPDFQQLARIAAAMQDLTGSPVMATALLVHRDEANQHSAAIGEARRMLKDSTSYFRANREDVLRSFLTDGSPELAFATWQAERQRPVLGDASDETQRSLQDLWDAAVAVGDLTTAPSLEASLFDENGSTQERGGRRTVSIAVVDDPLHRAALYALEQGLVESGFVDVSITYLPPSGLADAIVADEYDIVEASPMLVATGASEGLDLLVLSGGIEDLDSTLLFREAE